MKKLIVIGCFFLFVIPVDINGQDAITLPNVVPSNPEAASLLRYSEVPVSYYNGIPNTSIPLMTLEGRELSVPVSVSYHAGGHRVNEEATWVGLGWNLSAGGQITRTMRGIPDDDPNGYIHTIATVEEITTLCETSGALLNGKNCAYYTGVALANNTVDYEPDDFNYSMLGQSGRFMFNQNRTTQNPKGEIIPFPEKNVKITPIYNGTRISGWSLVDASGVEYRFATGDRIIRTTGSQITNNTAAISNHTFSSVYDPEYTETWNLTSVTTPNGDFISFSYDTYTPELGDYDCSFGSQSLVINDPAALDDPSGNGSEGDIITSFSEIRRSYTQLASITSAKGSIEFIRDTERRLDVFGNKKRLKKVILKDAGGTKIRDVEFIHDYFDSELPLAFPWNSYTPCFTNYDRTVAALTKRLYLKEIQFNGVNDGGSLSGNNFKYQFAYDAERLPFKWSTAQDHWGYYNGQTDNVTLIPFLWGNNPKAERNPSPVYTKACMLTSITYPEGGITSFAYENNKKIASTTELESAEVLVSRVFDVTPASTQPVVTTSGGITTIRYQDQLYIPMTATSGSSPTKTRIRYSSTTNRCENVGVDGFNDTEDQVCQDMWLYVSEVGVVANGSGISAIGTDGYLEVTKGSTVNVIVEINYAGDSYNPAIHTTSGRINWTETVLDSSIDGDNSKLLGGVRIKELTSSSAGVIVSKKTYKYEDGYQLSDPYYFSYQPAGQSTYSSVSLYPLLTTQAGYVGYGKVIEEIYTAEVGSPTNIANPGESEPEEVWTITREYSLSQPSFQIPEAPYVLEFTGGNLMKDSLVGQKNINNYGYFQNFYPQDDHRLVKGMKLKRSYKFIPDLFSEIANTASILDCALNQICPLNDVTYRLRPGQWLPIKNTRIMTNTGEEMTTVTETEYESAPAHFFPTTVTTTNSEQQIVASKTYYPQNAVSLPGVSGTHGAAITNLINQNRLAVPIETRQLEEDEVLATNRTNFNQFGVNYLPESVATAKLDETLENRIKYHSYTSYGQPQEVSIEDGAHIVYIWGYDFMYPVAKIENATYGEVISTGVDLTVLNSLTATEAQKQAQLAILRGNLPQALVSTYTYKPMIGISTVTDPRGYTMTYEYDDFQRLKRVKDADGNIVSENDYHYKGQ